MRKNIEKFSKNTEENSRYYSWVDCFTAFDSGNDMSNEQKAQVLFMYLASWGMLRKSFLMDYNYRILIPVVEEICKEEYQVLRSSKISDIEKNVDLIFTLKEDISNKLYEYNNKKKISQILLSKIIMGTLGCTVAYDTYVCKNLKEWNVASPTFNKKSISALINVYKENSEFEEYRQNIKKESKISYPPMKILDMALWSR